MHNCPLSLRSLCFHYSTNTVGSPLTYKQLCGAFALCWYLLGYPLSLTPLDSKTVLLWQFDFASNIQIYLGPHVKFPTFLSDFNQIWSISLIYVFTKSFHLNPSSGVLLDTWRTNGRTRGPIGPGSDCAKASNKTKHILIGFHNKQ